MSTPIEKQKWKPTRGPIAKKTRMEKGESSKKRGKRKLQETSRVTHTSSKKKRQEVHEESPSHAETIMSTPKETPIIQTPILEIPKETIVGHEETHTPVQSPERPQSPPEDPMTTPKRTPCI